MTADDRPRLAYTGTVKRAFASVGVVTAIAVAVFVVLSPAAKAPAPAPQPAAQPAGPQPLSAERARELLAGGALLADVREPHELAATGKLEGAVNVPLTRLKQLAAQGEMAPELESARQRPVILYCRTGRRSGQAGEILRSQGFTRVYNLGGFEGAVKAGLPPA